MVAVEEKEVLIHEHSLKPVQVNKSSGVRRATTLALAICLFVGAALCAYMANKNTEEMKPLVRETMTLEMADSNDMNNDENILEIDNEENFEQDDDENLEEEEDEDEDDSENLVANDNDEEDLETDEADTELDVNDNEDDETLDADYDDEDKNDENLEVDEADMLDLESMDTNNLLDSIDLSEEDVDLMASATYNNTLLKYKKRANQSAVRRNPTQTRKVSTGIRGNNFKVTLKNITKKQLNQLKIVYFKMECSKLSRRRVQNPRTKALPPNRRQRSNLRNKTIISKSNRKINPKRTFTKRNSIIGIKDKFVRKNSSRVNRVNRVNNLRKARNATKNQINKIRQSVKNNTKIINKSKNPINKSRNAVKKTAKKVKKTTKNAKKNIKKRAKSLRNKIRNRRRPRSSVTSINRKLLVQICYSLKFGPFSSLKTVRRPVASRFNKTKTFNKKMDI